MKILDYKQLLAVIFIMLSVILRIGPHIPNFSPITASALFGGVYLSKKLALIIPLVAMIISDYLLYPEYMFHSTTPFVWGSFLISGLIGIWLKKRKKPFYILGGSLLASLQFFLITNFGVWATTNMYPHNLAGLIQSYIMGIPFYKGTLLGDLFYTTLFFSVYELTLVLSKKLKLHFS